jgi:hypothetical protein
MTNTRQVRQLVEDDPTEIQQPPPGEQDSEHGELHIVVRKLELPVRPRGVLAE